MIRPTTTTVLAGIALLGLLGLGACSDDDADAASSSTAEDTGDAVNCEGTAGDTVTIAAQTYAFAGGVLTVPALRSTIMTIGGIEARHAAVLQVAAQDASPLDVFPGDRGFFPGDNPLEGIDGAVLSA